MINLVEYFETNCTNSYYSSLRLKICFCELVYNDYGELVGTVDIPYSLFDDQAVIDKFRELCQPSNGYNDVDNSWFILICFYLWNNGYIIEQFPNLLERPRGLEQFAYGDIRAYAKKHHLDVDGIVKWDVRRTIVADLRIIKKDGNICLDKEIENLISDIDTNNHRWSEMSLDTKLMNLNNTIEYLLKLDRKFIGIPDIENISDLVRPIDFRKITHVFRHGDTIQYRRNFSDSEKIFLIDYGVSLVHLICRNLD